MSSFQKDVKCQKVKHMDYGGGSQKNKFTYYSSHILMSILTSHMMVTKNPQNVHRKCYWTILVTFIFNIKIDINMCEPHYGNLFFLWTSSIVQVFDFFGIWHLFDNLTSFWQLEIFWHLTGPTHPPKKILSGPPHAPKEKYFLKSPRKVHPLDQGRYPIQAKVTTPAEVGTPSQGKYCTHQGRYPHGQCRYPSQSQSRYPLAMVGTSPAKVGTPS